MGKRVTAKTPAPKTSRAAKPMAKARQIDDDAMMTMKWVGQHACGFRNLMKYRLSDACKKAWVVGANVCLWASSRDGHGMLSHSHRRHPEQEAS